MEIDASLAARLVASQFPQWADLPISDVDVQGWDNRTFRLGDSLSVRLPSAEGYAVQAEKEHRWLPALAPHVPLAIPSSLAIGEPSELYPWHWSVRGWLDGAIASRERIADPVEFAASLAAFLSALQSINPSDGPLAGAHSAYRGAPLETYDDETRRTIDALGDRIDRDAATQVWDDALAAQFTRPAVWVHGDVAATNLLVRDGRLAAVLDFGCSAVGDPACDAVITWTFFEGAARDTFREMLPGDGAMWARARGWALWKALLNVFAGRETSSVEIPAAVVIDEVLADHRRS
jgi:aminoglycoside phosphotransferase (APT) family kinase protein